MRPVNLTPILQYVEASGCSIQHSETPVTLESTHNILCSCGDTFSRSTRYLHRDKNRVTTLSCGCLYKRWTNSAIDAALLSRGFHRTTNCNINGFQPSCMSVNWVCDTCNYSWDARVDSVINKASGCPQCAGNVPYTLLSLAHKLESLHRLDLTVLDIFDGSSTNQRHALFKCTSCNNEWGANIHNVIKFGYGCPLCNDNVGTRVEVDGIKFHSKLEYYFWKRYQEKDKRYVILLQQRYLPTRRLTCDFYIPELKAWIEVTGGYMMRTKKYSSTIDEKRGIVNQKNENFITLSTFTDIDNYLNSI